MHPADAVYTVDKTRKDKRSALRKVLERTEPSELKYVSGVCPFGCGAAEQDRLGWCCHLIGFVDDHKLPEGEIKNKRLTEGMVVELLAKDPDEHGRRGIIGGKEGRDVLKVGDYLVRNQTTLRVYRETDEPAEKPKEKELEAA